MLDYFGLMCLVGVIVAVVLGVIFFRIESANRIRREEQDWEDRAARSNERHWQAMQRQIDINDQEHANY